MTKKRKLFAKILNNQKNVAFDDMVKLVEAFGFRQTRVSGSHYIFEHPDIAEIVNLQEREGEAKPYQIRQFLALVEQHDLSIEETPEEEV